MANTSSGKRKRDRLQELLLSIIEASPVMPLNRSEKNLHITDGEKRLSTSVPPQSAQPQALATQGMHTYTEQGEHKGIYEDVWDIHEISKGVDASAENLRRIREEIGSKVRDLAARIKADRAELELWTAWLSIYDNLGNH